VIWLMSPISGITKVSKFHDSSFKLSNLKKDDRSRFRIGFNDELCIALIR